LTNSRFVTPTIRPRWSEYGASRRPSPPEISIRAEISPLSAMR